MFCKKCGQELENGSAYCFRCGCVFNTPPQQVPTENVTTDQIEENRPYYQEPNNQPMQPNIADFNPQNGDGDEISIDTTGIKKYIKTYFKNPNKACRDTAKSKDILTFIITYVIYIICFGLGNSALLFKFNNEVAFLGKATLGISVFLFFYGLISSCFLGLLPGIIAKINSILLKRKVNLREKMFESVLHTPIASFFLFFSFVTALIPEVAGLVFSLFNTFLFLLTYILSISPIIIESFPSKEGMGRKLMAAGNILAIIFTYILSVGIEIAIFLAMC